MGPTQPSIDSTVIIIARLAGSSWFSKPTTTTTYFWPLLLYARAAGCCCITPFAVGQTNCPCAGYVSIDRARCAFRQSYICGKRVCGGGGWIRRKREVIGEGHQQRDGQQQIVRISGWSRLKSDRSAAILDFFFSYFPFFTSLFSWNCCSVRVYTI